MERDENGKFVSDKNKDESQNETATMEKVETVPPETGDEQAATGEPKKRKRGRPPGSGNKKEDGPKKRGGAKKANVESLARQICGIHALTATLTGLPELLISEDEGALLAEAFVNVSEEYGFAISGKTAATVQLFSALGIVYGKRAFAIMMRMNAQERAAKDGPQNPNGFEGPVYTTTYSREDGPIQ